jgi:hypothetical protein
MENFSAQDYAKLLKFYKDKTSDLELQYLTLQINHSKEIEEKVVKAKESTKETMIQELTEAHNRIKVLEATLIKNSKQKVVKNKKK